MRTNTLSVIVCLVAVLGIAHSSSAQDGLQSLLSDAPPGNPLPTSEASNELRLRMPSATETKRALAEVKDIFKDDYAKSITPQAKAGLARQLLGQAEKTPSPAERWALLSEAMRLAADAGDMDFCFDAIKQAAADFVLDREDLELDALTKLAAKMPPQSLDGLARAALTLAQRATGAGKSSIASKGLALASGIARKTKNRTLVAEVTRLQQAARDQEKESKETSAIEAKLAANPGDPDVCLEAGKHFCFKAKEWDRGLPLLAKGSDTELARLAIAETNTGKAVDAVVSLADAWWDWAERERGPSKEGGLAHAADLYSHVVAKLQGLDRTRLEKRIKQAQGDAPSHGKRVALADLPEESATGMQYAFAKDGTFQGKPFTCQGKPWPKALTAMTHEKGTSIVYKLPPGSKRLVGTAGVFAPAGASPSQHPQAPLVFEVLVDGHSVWKSPPLPHQNDTVDFVIELYGGTTLELRSVSGSASSAWSAWLNPEIVY